MAEPWSIVIEPWAQCRASAMAFNAKEVLWWMLVDSAPARESHRLES